MLIVMIVERILDTGRSIALCSESTTERDVDGMMTCVASSSIE